MSESWDKGVGTVATTANVETGSDCCRHEGPGFPYVCVALVLILLLLAKEFLQLLRLGVSTYCRHLYNWYQMGFGVTACVSLCQWLFPMSRSVWLLSVTAVQLAC